MENINILLLTSSRFGLPSMRDMVNSRILKVVGIPETSTELIEEVSQLLSQYEIPIIILRKNDFETKLQSAIINYNINLCFVISFSYKIPKSLYNHQKLSGFFNVHNGLLPEYRGPDPVFQQIKRMEKYAGVTIHYLVDQLDAGDIVIQERILANSSDTYGVLSDKLAELASKLTLTIVRMLAMDLKIPSRPQNELNANYYKRQVASDVTIDWNVMDNKTIIALINACNPWNKGAVTKLNHKIVRLLKAEEYSDSDLNGIGFDPGSIVLFQGHNMIVSTLGGGLLSVQLIYIDEGFFHASTLKSLGCSVGQSFI